MEITDVASIRKLYPKGHPRHDDSPWVVEYTDNAGVRRRATPKSGLQRDAKAMMKKLEAEVDGGVHVAPSESMTIAEAATLYLTKCDNRVKAKDRLRAASVISYRCTIKAHIVPHLGRIVASKLTVRQVQDWVDTLAAGGGEKYGRPVVERSYFLLNYILNHCLSIGAVGKNVITKDNIRIPGRRSGQIEVPNKPQIRAILDHCNRTVRGRRALYLKTIVYIAVFAGLRRSEIRALTWANVDFDESIIRVRQGVDRHDNLDEPKSRAGIRDVPMGPELQAEIARWHALQGAPAGGFVFAREDGLPMRDGAMGNSFRALQMHSLHGRSLGRARKSHEEYPLFHFHALRHVYASLLIEAGLQPKRIQYLMGHSSIQMTFDRYGHLFEDAERVKAAIDRLGDGLLPALPPTGCDRNATKTIEHSVSH